MKRPDIARIGLDPLQDRDLRFLIEHMPQPARSYEEIGELLTQLPNTVESMLTSDYVLQKILDRRALILDVSPFLLFSVLLRRSLASGRTPVERRVLNYIANLLTLFIRTERVYRVGPRDPHPKAYIVELVEAAAGGDQHHRFLTWAHIGNYTLYQTGIWAEAITHRHRYGRRPVDLRYYVDNGRSYFQQAAQHPLAAHFGLGDVFLRLSLMFDHYRQGLNYMARHFMAMG